MRIGHLADLDGKTRNCVTHKEANRARPRRRKGPGSPNRREPGARRGHLDKLLPKRHKLTRGHHAAMPYLELRAFLMRLAEADGVGAIALRFLVLTASRTGEVIGVERSKIDVEAAVWTNAYMSPDPKPHSVITRRGKDRSTTWQRQLDRSDPRFRTLRSGCSRAPSTTNSREPFQRRTYAQ